MTRRTPRDTSTIARWVVAILLIGHAMIHLLGPLEIWGVADIAELTGQPSVDIGETVDVVLFGWLIAFLILLVAGIGVLARRAWWRGWAIAGVVVSQIVIVIWWGDAATGTIPNLLVVGAVALSGSLGLDNTEAGRA